MSRQRIALVGCGIISRHHLSGYQAHPERAEITVCFDTDPAKAKEMAELSGSKVLSTFEEVLASPDVDAIDLLTPHHVHKDQVLACLTVGKNVLCQKPLARTLEECDEILAAEAKSSAKLFYAEHNNTSPLFMKAAELIAEGRIGKLVATQAAYAHWQGGHYLTTGWRYDSKLSGGGTLLDGGIHFVAMMETIAGLMETVSAEATQFRPELGDEDCAVVNVRYACGALGTLFTSHSVAMWPPNDCFTAFGTEGLLTVGGMSGPLTLHRNDLPNRQELVMDKVDIFSAMMGNWLDVLIDDAPSLSTATTGRRQMALVLAAYRSAKTGIRENL